MRSEADEMVRPATSTARANVHTKHLRGTDGRAADLSACGPRGCGQTCGVSAVALPRHFQAAGKQSRATNRATNSKAWRPMRTWSFVGS